MYPVQLEGSKVRLREFRRDDGDAAVALVGDNRVTRWLSFDSRTREQTVDMIEGIVKRARQDPRIEYYLAVVLPTDELVGFARLGVAGVHAATLGYAIAADQCSHGYACDATRTLVNFGFQTLELHRISAAIGPDNEPSIAIAKRLGMSYEGRLRDHVFTNGAWRDSLLYSVLTYEWNAAE